MKKVQVLGFIALVILVPFSLCVLLLKITKTMKYIEVINLKRYQHYSDRPNIWIKWYQKSLEDYKFQQLFDSERWLFVGVIMLAVNAQNHLCYDPCWIRNRVCRVDGKGVSKVRAGLAKMAKLGLISIKNDSIDKKEKKKERESFINLDENASKKEELRNFLKGKGIIKSIK